MEKKPEKDEDGLQIDVAADVLRPKTDTFKKGLDSEDMEHG